MRVLGLIILILMATTETREKYQYFKINNISIKAFKHLKNIELGYMVSI